MLLSITKTNKKKKGRDVNHTDINLGEWRVAAYAKTYYIVCSCLQLN